MIKPGTANGVFDAAILDSENRPIAVVEVKAHPIAGWEAILPGQLAKLAERVTYVVTIDPNCIHIYRPAGGQVGEPIVDFDTGQILEHYDADFSKKRVFESYLLTLVEAWIRDLAYHWKSDAPPGAAELEQAGVLEKLAGGTTQRLGA
jgi:hypothetical protein